MLKQMMVNVHMQNKKDMVCTFSERCLNIINGRCCHYACDAVPPAPLPNG